jgi:hypothetical protein
VCVKFSKLVMVRVGWFIQVNESSIPLFDRKGLSLRPDLPCLLVMVCILAKGSGDCDITRIP